MLSMAIILRTVALLDTSSSIIVTIVSPDIRDWLFIIEGGGNGRVDHEKCTQAFGVCHETTTQCLGVGHENMTQHFVMQERVFHSVNCPNVYITVYEGWTYPFENDPGFRTGS